GRSQRFSWWSSHRVRAAANPHEQIERVWTAVVRPQCTGNRITGYVGSDRADERVGLQEVARVTECQCANTKYSARNRRRNALFREELVLVDSLRASGHVVAIGK